MIYKLENINSLTAARWAAAEGFDYISFNFDKTNINYIPPMQVAEICKWVTGTKLAGNFLNVEREIILDLYKLLNLDVIEIDLKTAEKLFDEHSLPIILRIEQYNTKECFELALINKNIFAFSLNEDIEMPPNFPMEKTFISSKFRGDTNFEPYGITFDSANETEPGLIDFEELENSKNHWKQTYCI